MVLPQLLKKLLSSLEALIIALVLLVSYNYLEVEKTNIKADGKGYYEYLPAVFIYQDLTWNYLDTIDTPGYYKHSEYNVGAIIGSGKDRHNKYFVGTAILMAPFFGMAHIAAKISDHPADGYSLPYQKFMWISVLFYLWLGLFFIRKLLLKLKIKRLIIFITQLLLAFATPILHYVTFEPTFSHVYSFAAVSALMYCGYQFIKVRSNSYLYLLAILCALTFLIRPFNILIIPALLFAFKDIKELKEFATDMLRNKKVALFIALVLGAMLISLQCMLWYIQKGSIILDSYGHETFDFTNPHFFNILFSYKKGLFIYSPVLLLGAILGLYYGIKNKKYIPLLAIIIPVAIFTYVLSSWWSWWYGMSYGQRSYIDILVIFAITIAYGLNQLPKKTLYVVLPIFLAAIPITVVQGFQYKNYILHWDSMEKDSFWEVFMKTTNKYRGVLWQEKKTYASNQIIFKSKIKANAKVPISTTDVVLDIIDFSSTINGVFDMVELECDIKDADSDAKVILSLKTKSDSSVYWNQIYTYHQTRGSKEKQGAQFQFTIPKDQFQKADNLYLAIETENKEIEVLKGVVKFISFDESLDNSDYSQRVQRKFIELKSHKSVIQEARSREEYKGLSDDEIAQLEAERIIQRNDRVKMLKTKMQSSPEWLKEIQEKAQLQGLSLEEMMDIDAQYIIDNEEK